VKLDELAELDHRGKKIAVYHGTIEAITTAIIKSHKYDIVIHKPKVEKDGGTLVINPGELCGYLRQKS
jgi:hypothetical protein